MNRLALFLTLASLWTVPLLLAPRPAGAEITFSGLDISGEETLLFESRAECPGYGDYRTLFISGLRNKALRQLTVFPESAQYLRQSGQFQIFNRFGLFRTDGELNRMAPVEGFPAFVEGRRIATGKIPPVSASPDGRYFLYQRAVSDTRGDLFLYTAEGEETVIAEGVELSYDRAPAAWAPDSRYFIYEQQGELYYYSLAQREEDRVLAQPYRRIGPGEISSVYWNRANEVYYLDGSLVYQILASELFTRSLYSGMFRTGRVVGKLPFEYDPSFDRFWISPASDQVMVSRGGRSLYVYSLQSEDYQGAGKITSRPYLLLPRSRRVKKVLWSRSGVITLLSGSVSPGDGDNRIFRMTPPEEEGKLPVFRQTDDAGVRSMALSPDETQVAVITQTGVTLRRCGTWRELSSHDFKEPRFVFWVSNSEMILAGAYSTLRMEVDGGGRRVLALSQPGEYGYTPEEENVQVRTEGLTYTFDRESRRWSTGGEFDVRDSRIASDYFRVYTRQLSRGPYGNTVMVRNVEGYGTEPLFPADGGGYEPFPEEEQAVSFDVFSHGSRVRRREVSLVFNLADSVEGLTEVLNTLEEYGVKTTFFLNGEFMRRHPDAVRELASSRHEVGSLFHVYFNMADSQFQLDGSFIKRGLATNEDEYFELTRKELALYWHAPYYYVNSDLLEAAGSMNYLYVGRDVDPLDWVGKDYRRTNPELYQDALTLVERVLEKKKPGSIIPVRLGIPDGGREDYLYHKLDLLINGLLDRGYSLVPVSTLTEHAE